MSPQEKLDHVEIIRRRINELIQELSTLEQQLFHLTNQEDPE